jgi:hypothetical protein
MERSLFLLTPPDIRTDDVNIYNKHHFYSTQSIKMNAVVDPVIISLFIFLNDDLFYQLWAAVICSME